MDDSIPAPAFNPKHLQELMPSSRKKTDIQLLKRHKNKCMSIMEEAAKNDRYECCYTLQPFEIGSALQYNLDHTAKRLCKWLRRKNFGAELDDDNDLCINVSWRKEQDHSDEQDDQYEQEERKQRHRHGKRVMKGNEIPTIGAAIPLLPHQQPIIPIAKQPYVAPMNHPWFGWMKQEPIREPSDGGEKRAALPRNNTTPMKKLFQKKN